MILPKKMGVKKVARIEVEERAGHWCSNEDAKSGDAETHSEAGANLVQIIREGDDGGRGQQNECA